MFLCPKSTAFWCQPYFCTAHLLGDLGTKLERGITWETEPGWGSATPDSRPRERGFSSKLPVAKAMPPSQACCPRVVWWYLMLQLRLDRARVSWTCWHLRPCSCHLSEYTRGKGEQSHITHNGSVQELSVNLRGKNSQSQSVTFRKPFHVLLQQ